MSCPTTITRLSDNPLSVFPMSFSQGDASELDIIGDVRSGGIELSLLYRQIRHRHRVNAVQPEAAGLLAQPTPGDEVPAVRAVEKCGRLDLAFTVCAEAVGIADPQHPSGFDRLPDDRRNRL